MLQEIFGLSTHPHLAESCVDATMTGFSDFVQPGGVLRLAALFARERSSGYDMQHSLATAPKCMQPS